jgi:hypothetical protein
MTTPNDPNANVLSSDQLANQLFDAALKQYPSDPREAARQVILFLSGALVYAITHTAGDDSARKALLKTVGDSIAAAPSTPPASPPKP